MQQDRGDGTATASSSGGGDAPACYLISYNQQSKHNIGAKRVLQMWRPVMCTRPACRR